MTESMEPADHNATAYINGKVYTVDGQRPWWKRSSLARMAASARSELLRT